MSAAYIKVALFLCLIQTEDMESPTQKACTVCDTQKNNQAATLGSILSMMI